MDPPTIRTEIELARLHERLDGVERRLAELEGHGSPTIRDERVAGGSSEAPASGASRSGAVELLPLVGRTLLVFGGAFVLRAVTEAEMLAPALGSALGIAYAMVWFVMADRSARRAADAGAVWHGIAGTVIAFPLVWETTVQFRSLDPKAAAVALAGIATVGLTVAWRRGLVALASIVALAAAVTLVALAVAMKLPVLFGSWLLVLGLATFAIGVNRGWGALPWIAAVPAHAVVALLTAVVLIADSQRVAELLRPGSLVGLELALVIGYIGSFVIRTLVWRADVGALEVTLGLAAVVIGLGGALAVARTYPLAWLPLGLTAATLGTAGYTVSFTLIDRSARRTNFIFFSSLALTFALVAATALLPSVALAVTLATGAVLMGWAGARFQRATLSLHGAVYAAGAAVASGLIAHSMGSWSGEPTTEWIDAAVLISLAGAIAYCFFSVAEHGRTWGRLSTVPKLVVLIVALVGSGGVLTSLVAAGLPVRGGVVDPQGTALLRTAVLAIAAVALARLGRHPRVLQASWLVYPVLIIGGLKLLIEDLRVGSPAILVASFALYGGALIVAPRLAHARSAAARSDRDVRM